MNAHIYPSGFNDWPEERKNAYFSKEALAYQERAKRERGKAAPANGNGAAPVGEKIEEQDDRPPAFSDDALALRFADRHSADLRFVAGWGNGLGKMAPLGRRALAL
jgi:hypothetical protein